MALKIIAYFPRHHLYCEPFGGAFSVGLRKPRAKAEIWNDLDETLVHLMRVLRDPDQSAELIRLLALTPYARGEFDAAYEPTDDPVERARRTIVRSFMGFGSDGTSGVYKTGFRANVTSNLKLPAQEWAAYPEALQLIVERIRGVVIEQCDAFDLMKRVDGPGTLHFVDPPYHPKTRSAGNRRRGAGYHVYEHELSEEDHVRLLGCVQELKGMVVLCGYPLDLYDEALAGWERVEFDAYADGGRPRKEVLWINQLAAERRRSGARPRRHSASSPGPLFGVESVA